VAENFKIGFIGAGNMAQAILYGMVNKQLVSPKNIFAYDVLKSTLDKVSEKSGVHAVASNVEAVEKSDIIVLAVKPHICPVVLDEIGEKLAGKAVLSIVSGIPFTELRKKLPETARILVIQPNTPALVSEGMTLFASTHSLSSAEMEFAKSVFGALGKVEIIPDHLLMVGGTASGASTAYMYMFIEAIADASVERGFPRDLAYKLCAQAMVGAGTMVLETGLHPGALKDQVCSPSGSTIRGVHALEREGMRGAVMDAIKACNDRWDA
jgi:pyrroline-5-carboxylate reductase